MSLVNIVKRIKSDGRWKMLSIPRNSKANYDWNSLLAMLSGRINEPDFVLARTILPGPLAASMPAW